MKKLAILLAAVLALTSLLPLVASAEMPAMNTTDEIKLTYAVWDDVPMAQFLADKFHEKYPNITVEVIEVSAGTADYAANLANLAASNQLPDVYQFLSLDNCIMNGWLTDITQYTDNDPEYANYFESLQKVGYIDGKRNYYVFAEYLPITIYCDQGVFEKLNVPMPSQDWTYDEMLGLMESMTNPGEGIWGYNSFLGLITFGPVALTNDAHGEFGWDGEAYHFEEGWAKSISTEAEYQRLGYRALQASAEWAAAAGSNDVWPGNSGLVAIQHDAWWTMNNIYTLSETIERGIKMVPYNIPASTDVEISNATAFMDAAAVASTCKYPREAFEFLKYVSYSTDGWLARCEAFATLTNEAGEKLYRMPNCLPVTNDPAVWAEYRKLYDESAYWDGFFANANRPVPLGGVSIPGFGTFLADVYQNGDFNGVIGIEPAVFQGVADPYDHAEMLNTKGREAYDKAMEEFVKIYGAAE